MQLRLLFTLTLENDINGRSDHVHLGNLLCCMSLLNTTSKYTHTHTQNTSVPV